MLDDCLAVVLCPPNSCSFIGSRLSLFLFFFFFFSPCCQLSAWSSCNYCMNRHLFFFSFPLNYLLRAQHVVFFFFFYNLTCFCFILQTMKNVRHLFKTLGGGYSVFPPLFSVLCFLFFLCVCAFWCFCHLPKLYSYHSLTKSTLPQSLTLN